MSSDVHRVNIRHFYFKWFKGLHPLEIENFWDCGFLIRKTQETYCFSTDDIYPGYLVYDKHIFFRYPGNASHIVTVEWLELTDDMISLIDGPFKLEIINRNSTFEKIILWVPKSKALLIKLMM